MSLTVTILFVDPAKPPELKQAAIEGPGGLEEIYRLIDSDVMEVQRPFPMRPDVVLVCDEEGKLNKNRNRPNRYVPELQDVIHGPFFFARSEMSNDPEEGEVFASLSTRDAAWLMGRFGGSNI